MKYAFPFGEVMKSLLQAIDDSDPSLVSVIVAAHSYETSKGISIQCEDVDYVDACVSTMSEAEFLSFLSEAAGNRVMVSIDGDVPKTKLCDFISQRKDFPDDIHKAVVDGSWMVKDENDVRVVLLRPGPIVSLMERIANFNDELRNCQQLLLNEIGFKDSFVYDGETISKHDVESWSSVLEAIDKMTHYV